MAIKQKISKWLPNNRFARSVTVLASATLAGQAIMVLASPLLTRIYSPDDFGLLAIYISLLGMISVVATLRYQFAIPLPDKDNRAASIVLLGLIIVCVISAITFTVILFLHKQIALALNSEEIEPYLWVIPVGILFVNIYQIFYYWSIRTKAFTAIAKTKIAQSLVAVVIQLGGFFLGPLALMLGHISGQGVGFTSLGLSTFRGRMDMFKSMRFRHISWAARRYKDFPIYSTFSDFLNKAGAELPILLFTALYSPAMAGFYVLTRQVLYMPGAFVGKAISDVFFSRSASAYRKGELAPLVAGIHKKLAQIAMPPALVVILIGPTMFSTIFGEEWRQAGEFARWMAPCVYVVFITTPLDNLTSVLEKQAYDMVFMISLFLTRTSALIGGSYTGNINLTIALFSFSGTLCWVAYLFWIVKKSGNKATVIVESTGKAFLWSAGLVAPLAFVIFLPSYATTQFWLVAILLTALLIAVRYATIFKEVWN